MTTTTVKGSVGALAVRPSRLRRRATAVAYPMAALVFIVLLWQAVVVGLHVPVFVMPTPVSVAQALGDNWQLLLTNLVPTAVESLLGFLAGNVFAAVLAVIFVSSRSMERAFFPLAVVLRTIPIVAIAPVLVLMLGYGYAPKIVIAALITFFPTLVNLVRGLNAIEPQQAELLRVLSASSAEVMTKVRETPAFTTIAAHLRRELEACWS